MSINIEEQYDKVYCYCYFRLKHQHWQKILLKKPSYDFLKATVTKIPDRHGHICIRLQEIYVCTNFIITIEDNF